MPMGRHSALLLTMAVAATLATAGFVVAAAGPQPVPAALDGTAAHRNVVWFGVPQAAPRSFHIESTSVGTPVQDEFQITYADGNFTLAYQRVAGGPITTQYTMTPWGLLEWNDTAGEGQFGDGAGIVAYTQLGPPAFGRFPVLHTNMTTADGVAVDSFLVQSNKGDVSLNLTIADGFVHLPSGQNLTPMEAKLTLEVNHTMTRSDTRLSLQIAITTDQKVSLENQSWDDVYDFSSDDRALNVSSDSAVNPSAAFFAWSNTASVNGVLGPVVPSVQTNETSGSHDLYLTYPQQAPGQLQLQIIHDPTIGVVSAAYLSSLHPPPPPPLGFAADAVVYAVSLAGIAVLVAGSVYLVRRRRRAGP